MEAWEGDGTIILSWTLSRWEVDGSGLGSCLMTDLVLAVLNLQVLLLEHGTQ
jgi:hypothetical protein